jgi:hypothetical protein
VSKGIHALHAPIAIADTESFGDVRVLHNVPLLGNGYSYDRANMDETNAVLIDATLADGTRVSLWPDGTIQLTPSGNGAVSYNHRIGGTLASIEYLETVHGAADDDEYDGDVIADKMLAHDDLR